MPRILIAASGTGGHIFPALAIAEALPKTWQIHWLGVSNRLETNILPKTYDLTTISVGGLQGNFLNKVLQICKLIAAIKSVVSLIKARNIQIVFTTGGYISGPAILAAKFCGIKVILHESNAIPGKVTRFLGRFCDLIAIGFPSAIQFLPKCKTVFTGTPVRKLFRFQQPLPSWAPDGSGPLIVVIGGSQGAVGVNQMVRGAYKSLLEKGCRIVHLTGKNDIEFNKINHHNLVIKEFTNDIPGLLQNADIAISRAGAGIISELAISGTPSILIPYKFAADDHQIVNAKYIAEKGGAVIIHENINQTKTLINIINRLLKERLNANYDCNKLLLNMKKEIKKIAFRDSHEKLASLIINSL